MTTRRRLLRATAALPWLASGPSTPAAAGERVLRLALAAPETSFDPPQTNSDYYSNSVIANIYEALLGYDPLARPARLVPVTAVALPEVADNFTRFHFTLKRGILFHPHPAFGGAPRELVAADYVYSFKRFFDPALNSGDLYQFEELKLLGLAALRQRALQAKAALDYDADVPGLRATGRYTLVLHTEQPNPRLAYLLATPSVAGAVAREVVQHHGSDIGAHPIGTGAYRLGRYRRASHIELLRAPAWRGEVYSGQPNSSPQAQQAAQVLAGRSLPIADRVLIDIIEEQQPRWLAFLNGEHDILEVPGGYTALAAPGGKPAPFLQRRGISAQVAQQPDMVMTFFNCTDPVVGGYTADKVALRRAMALALDNRDYIRVVRGGLALPAQSLVAPHLSGYDPGYKSEMGDHDPARARALLDMHGYLDRDGDGWRELPDGRPLTLRMGAMATQADRRANELWQRNLQAVGLRIRFDVATWPELLKKARANQLQIWGYGWTATSPDGGYLLSTAYGPNASESNDARFALPAYDALYQRIRDLPDGAEREALMRQAKNLLVAYMPYKAHAHRSLVDLAHPWVQGYWRHPFMRDIFRYISVEPR